MVLLMVLEKEMRKRERNKTRRERAKRRERGGEGRREGGDRESIVFGMGNSLIVSVDINQQ